MFFKAAQQGDVTTVRDQLDAGQDVNATERGGYTALFLAALGQHDEVALLLLERGADPNLADTTLGQVPLMFAGNIIGYETKGFLAVNTARSRATPVMGALVEHGANPNARDKKDGRTPLFFAVRASNGDGIKFLASKGADVNAVDDEGKTPLMVAAETLDKTVAGELCASGADKNVKDGKGRSARDVAQRSKGAGSRKGPELEQDRNSFLSILETCR
jgi:ankyrin repeat protein